MFGGDSHLWGPYRKVVEETWTSVNRLQEDGSLHQIIDVDEHLAHGHDLQALVKRCLISSSYVVLKTPRMMYVQPGPDEYLAGVKEGWRMSAEQQELERVILDAGLQGNDYCIVLPSSMTVSAEIAGGEALDSVFARVEEANDEIRNLEKHVYNVPVGADYAMVRRLLRQDSSTQTLNTGVMLPEIGNLSLDDMTRLRKDYDNSFARIRYSLKKYLDGIKDADSERKFQGVIEEIDHECRVAEDEFKRIKRKHSRSLVGMLVTASLVGVAAAAETMVPGALAVASATIGSVTLNNLLSSRIKRLDDADDLGKGDYWIAWKIQQENVKRGG